MSKFSYLYGLFSITFALTSMSQIAQYQYGSVSGLQEFAIKGPLLNNMVGSWYTVKEKTSSQQYLFVNLTFQMQQAVLPPSSDIQLFLQLNITGLFDSFTCTNFYQDKTTSDAWNVQTFVGSGDLSTASGNWNSELLQERVPLAYQNYNGTWKLDSTQSSVTNNDVNVTFTCTVYRTFESSTYPGIGQKKGVSTGLITDGLSIQGQVGFKVFSGHYSSNVFQTLSYEIFPSVRSLAGSLQVLTLWILIILVTI